MAVQYAETTRERKAVEWHKLEYRSGPVNRSLQGGSLSFILTVHSWGPGGALSLPYLQKSCTHTHRTAPTGPFFIFRRLAS